MKEIQKHFRRKCILTSFIIWKYLLIRMMAILLRYNPVFLVFFLLLYSIRGDIFMTEWSTSDFDMKIRFKSSALDTFFLFHSIIKYIRTNKISRLGWMCVCWTKFMESKKKTIAQDFSELTNWHAEIWELFYWIAATRLSIVSVCNSFGKHSMRGKFESGGIRVRISVYVPISMFLCVNSKKQTSKLLDVQYKVWMQSNVLKW